MTTLEDIDFLRRVAELQNKRRDRRARRLLALYIGGRRPSEVLLINYSILCECVTRCYRDLDSAIETQAMAASV